MKYTIEKLNRTVELNDELVSEYTKYKDLRDNTFIIGMKLYCKSEGVEFSAIVNNDDEELTKLCNIILVKDLENIRDNAVALRCIRENKDALKSDWESGETEISVEQERSDGEQSEQERSDGERSEQAAYDGEQNEQ